MSFWEPGYLEQSLQSLLLNLVCCADTESRLARDRAWVEPCVGEKEHGVGIVYCGY